MNANGDLVGYNMYAYCSNNPVMYADYTGEDAIFICSPFWGGGHASVFIETEDGWWLIQFAGKKKDDAEVYSKYNTPLDYNQVEAYIRNKGYDRTVYLEGDFTASYDQALAYMKVPDLNTYDGAYNLFGNNCLHFVIDILSYGQCIYPEINSFISKCEIIMPVYFYYELLYRVARCKPTINGADNNITRHNTTTNKIEFCCIY